MYKTKYYDGFTKGLIGMVKCKCGVLYTHYATSLDQKDVGVVVNYNNDEKSNR